MIISASYSNNLWTQIYDRTPVLEYHW
jgi:hypothetical protein